MTFTSKMVTQQADHLAEAYDDLSNAYVVSMLRDFAALLRESESAEPVAWMTHHDEPMLFPTRAECEEYCSDDEFPIPLYTVPMLACAQCC